MLCWSEHFQVDSTGMFLHLCFSLGYTRLIYCHSVQCLSGLPVFRVKLDFFLVVFRITVIGSSG